MAGAVTGHEPAQLPDNLRFLVVEGIPGVRKSELAAALAKRLGMQLVLEDFEDNPFLERFYLDPARWAFQTQLAYLASRYRQLSKLHNLDLFHAGVITDYSLDKDRIFAQLYLSGDDYRLFDSLFVQMARYVPRPDLVIYLQSNVEKSMENIRTEGRTYEASISSMQLLQLHDAYTEHFFRYTISPVMIINIEDMDVEGDTSDLEELVHQIVTGPHHGVTYLKPGRSQPPADLYSGASQAA